MVLKNTSKKQTHSKNRWYLRMQVIMDLTSDVEIQEK